MSEFDACMMYAASSMIYHSVMSCFSFVVVKCHIESFIIGPLPINS